MTVQPGQPAAATSRIPAQRSTQTAGDPVVDELLALAAENQAERAALISATLAAVLGVWAQVEMTQIIRSWFTGGLGARVFVLLSAAQESTASQAPLFVERSLAALRTPVRERPPVDARTFAGIASDGRDLEGLLAGAPVLALQRIRRGEPAAVASMAAENFLRRAVTTQIADAGRAADQVAITVAEPAQPRRGRKVVRYGWVRMLNPPSCSRCVVLAGKFYRWNEGFKRHEMCWPAGTVVSGPEVLASSRRWYEGQLVTIRTAGGEQVSVTGNHPVLTLRGWVPAQFVQEGDQVLRSTRSEGAHALVVPDHDQVPARIEDVLAALGVHGATAQVPTTTEDFHGDGVDGQVDVVLSDRLLRYRRQAALAQQVVQHPLTVGLQAPGLLAGQRGLAQGLLGVPASTPGFVGGSGLGPALPGGHSGGPGATGVGPVSRLDTAVLEKAAHHRAGDPVLLGGGEFAQPITVIGEQVRDVHGLQPGPRWDPTGDARTMQHAASDTRRARDLVERLSGQVEPDRVIDVTRIEWSGHVYSLTTSEGWVSSNNIITSNCDCAHIPAVEDVEDDLTTDPMEYFRSLSRAEQDDAFGKVNAQAIRDGADISQVVNATTRGGVRTAQGGFVYTLEGATKRGLYGRRSNGVLRPTPWQIYRDAHGDRDEAIRMLRQFKYIYR